MTSHRRKVIPSYGEEGVAPQLDGFFLKAGAID